MKSNELVWRTLADAALSGNRRWANLADLAFQAGVPVTTAHLATKKLSDIGAISRYGGGGFSVVSPDKLLTLLSGWRNLENDTVAITTMEGFEQIARKQKLTFAFGGPTAAVHHLGGQNKVSDFSKTLAYIHFEDVEEIDWPAGDEVRVLAMDARAAKTWQGFSSLAQTYADLFASPGWQASEFRLALRDRFVLERDWDQSEAHGD